MGKSVDSKTILVNRKARHEYAIEQTYEAGLVLQGWEVKSIREGKLQLADSHVIIRRGEAFLLNANVTPLATVSTHIEPEVTRTRKLLLHAAEIQRLASLIERQGYTLIPLKAYWHRNRVKVEIAVAKGMKKFDKRSKEQERDWERQRERLFKKSSRGAD